MLLRAALQTPAVPSCAANGISRQRGAAASREAATKIHTKPKIHGQSMSQQLKLLFLPPKGISTVWLNTPGPAVGGNPKLSCTNLGRLTCHGGSLAASPSTEY